MTYYGDLSQLQADAAIRVGWRHALEQAYRFEIVVEVAATGRRTILDVGCGLGALAQYAAAKNTKWTWTGLESHPPFATTAARYGEVVASRFQDFDDARTFDCCVAVGTLAGTPTSCRTLTDFCAAVGRSICLIHLRPDSDRAWFDPAVRPPTAADVAASIAALERSGWNVTHVPISTTDAALVASRTDLPPLRTIEDRFAATIDGPWGRVPPARIAWLAAEIGLRDEAERWLRRAGPGDLAELVRARLSTP